VNLRQIRCLVQVVDCGLSVSKASAALNTSQPSISRHVLSLEEELGIRIFSRSKKRLTGLTRAGTEAVRVARAMLREAESLQNIGRDHGEREDRSITIAASHTHARYSLPRVVQAFRKKYPRIRLVLRQGEPAQITEWLATGHADISISAEPASASPDVIFFPCYDYDRIILTPKSHPLLKAKRVTLKALAEYPLITYESTFKVYRQIMDVFAHAGIDPDFVLSATDVDVMKTYVKCGMGLAIVASLAYDPEEDKSLRAIDAKHLFPPVSIKLGLRRGAYVPAYTYDFIELFAPQLKRAAIETAK
jgi:LysR family transcriptional regulator, cys regulon transcriptional activator